MHRKGTILEVLSSIQDEHQNFKDKISAAKSEHKKMQYTFYRDLKIMQWKNSTDGED